MSLYISPNDYARYGLPSTVTQIQVFEASAYIDSYVRRPEGLAWKPDYTGNPAYMDGLSPTMTLTLANPISAGSNVVATVTPAWNTPDTVGTVFVIDRATAMPGYSGTNVCEVTPASLAAPSLSLQNNQIVLATVTQPHAAGALLEAGLVIEETRPMLHERSLTRITRTHFARLISGVGRYGYGRKSDVVKGTYNEVNLLATLSTFGGPPQWNPFDVNQTSVDIMTGEVWVPAGILLAYFTDVRLYYLAGFSAFNIPDPIKRACARVVSNIINLDPTFMGGLVRRISAGPQSLDRLTHTAPGRGAAAGNTILDQNTMALLDPFRVRNYF